MLLPSEASFFFFHHLIKLYHLSSSSSSLRSLSSALISHQAFISPQHQSQSRRHRRRQPQPQPSPSPTTAPAIAVPRHRQPTPSSSRPRPSPAPATTLTSLLHRCRPTHALDPLRRSKPLTHLEVSAPTLPSQPTPQPTPVAVASPLQVSALSSFLVNFLIVVLA